MSDWNTYDKPDVAKRVHLEQQAEELLELQKQLEQIQEKIERISDELLTHFPEDAGEFQESFGSMHVTVNRAERWNWDTDVLEGIVGAMPKLPECVNRKLSVDKRKFQKLPEPDRLVLLPALERKPGPAKISVVADIPF